MRAKGRLGFGVFVAGEGVDAAEDFPCRVAPHVRALPRCHPVCCPRVRINAAPNHSRA